MTRFRLALIAVLTGSFAAPQLVFAQTQADSGQRVRVTQAGGKRITGVLQLMTLENLTVRDTVKHQEYVVSRMDITLLERSLGRHKDFPGNFLKTFAVATVGVGAIFAIGWKPCESTELFGCFLYPESRSAAFGYGALIGAAAGLPLGIVAGATKTSERWIRVSAGEPGAQDSRLSAFVGSGKDRSTIVGLGFSIR